jgi:type VI secretion system protein ImpB
MAKEASVAPRERVNITYKPATGDAKEEVELPFKMVVLGDFTLRADDRPLEERKPIRVDKDNFNEVLKKQDLSLDINVEDRLSGNEDSELGITLKFSSLKDFAPESVAEQVPELNKLLELRKALQALKGPLGNLPAFRKKLQALLKTEEDVDRVLKELSSAAATTDETGA